MKIKYRRSFLGVFWTVLAPLSTAMVYFVVFKLIMKIQKPDYLVLVISGVMAWNYFAQTVSEGVSHYVDQQNLITKIYLPFHVFNFTTSSTNLVTLLFSVPIAMGAALLQGKDLGWALLLLPYFLGCLFLITYASSIIVAVSYVFFRDLRQLIAIILQLLFYATPILYTTDMIPEEYRWVVLLNPMGVLVPAIQNCFVRHDEFSLVTFLVPLAWALGLTLVSAITLRQKRRAVVETL